VFVGEVAISIRICDNIRVVVAGLAKLAGSMLLSTDCSETSAFELLAAGDSLVWLCVGMSIGSLVGSEVDQLLSCSLGSSGDSFVVVARTGSAVAWTVVTSPVPVVRRAAVCFRPFKEPLGVGQ
jgi:hypothetical protein